MKTTYHYPRSESYHRKKLDWLLPALSSAWTEFQLAVLLLPDSPAKNNVLSHIEQANLFYREQDLKSMKVVIFYLFDLIKTSSLSAPIKEKATHVFSLFKDFMFFEEEG